MEEAVNVKKGMAVIYNNEICIVLEAIHTKPGKGKAFMQFSMRSIKSGRSLQNKFSPEDRFEVAPLVPKDVQFLYKDMEGYHFMNLEDFHSFHLSEAIVGDNKNFLKENMEFVIRFHDEAPIILELPSNVNLKVVESAPGVKGDSATNTLKPATLETGYVIKVPLFINEGDTLKIDTRTGEYMGRA